MTRPDDTVDLLVCTKCKRLGEASDEAERPGAVLYSNLIEANIPGVTIHPVECLSNCDHGCTIALRGPGRWTYVYGRFDPDVDAITVSEGAARYAATSDGLVPWRERPEHFRKNCIARVPPLEPSAPNLGDT